MSEKPLCGYCYNECTDECCDKRRIDVLERQLEEAREEEASLIKWLDQERQDWGSSEKDSWNPYHRVLSEIKEQCGEWI